MDFILLRRALPHQENITGDGSANMIDWNEIIDSSGITYDSSTGKCRLSKNGIYIATMSLPYGNLIESNTSGAGWFHGGLIGENEPFIYNGNPWAENNTGLTPGGGSDIINCGNSHIFKVDVSLDPFVWVMVKIAGNTSKNVTLLYDAFFSIYQLSA